MMSFCKLLTLSLAAYCSLSLSAFSADKPNIMLFLVDDMGIMDTSLPFLTDQKGTPIRSPLNDWYHTPSMERLAQQGIRLNQFYAMSVCSPTRISIMTGQNAARHRTTNFINPYTNNRGTMGPPNWNWKGIQPGTPTLPSLLSAAGYKSIHIGKAHFAPLGKAGEDPTTIGFDINIAGNAQGQPGSYLGKKHFSSAQKNKKRTVPDMEAYSGSDIFLSEALTLEAKKIVTQCVADDAPFFLHFAHYAAHSPFESDARFASRYENSSKPQDAKNFATLIEGVDRSLGELLQQFDELGIAEDTLVIFLGDNGTDAPLGSAIEVACAAPLRGKKASHYEGGIRVPFIAAWAKPNPDNPWQQKLPIAAGQIRSDVTNVTDILPTLLELAGIPAPPQHILDGHPLSTLLQGNDDPLHKNEFLMHYPHGIHRSNYFSVWRNGDWKLIFHAHPHIKAQHKILQSKGERWQLFNLANDPSESENLASKHPDVLARMVTELNEQLEFHEAQYAINQDGQPIKPTLTKQ